MIDLTTNLLDDVTALCHENAAEIATVLARAFHAEVKVTVGKSGTYDRHAVPEEFDSAGLAIAMQCGERAMAAMLPVASGLLQNWEHKQDANGEATGDLLAQEIAKLVLPATMPCGKVGTAWTDDMAGLLADAEVADGAVMLPLDLDHGGKVSRLTLVWPCGKPSELLPPVDRTFVEPLGESLTATTPSPSPPRAHARTLEELPPYSKHLLKISVPVSVRLVSKKLSIKEVLELGPGAMVSFDKSCDGPLELTVGDQVIAEGAAVKVGERFGLEIEKMTLPVEHFWPIKRRA